MPPESSKEEKAFLMKAIWGALLAPQWKREDLITFGTAIFDRKPLSKIDEKTFKAIYPFLVQITDAMEQTLTAKAREVHAEIAAIAEKSSEPAVDTLPDETQGAST